MILKDTNKKKEIIKLAFETFYEQGFHATGVDKLLLESGISKRTLYKYFSSKEDLIREAIVFYKKNFFNAMDLELKKRCKNPAKKIAAIFDMKYEKLKRRNYSGCFAVNARIEFEGKNKEIESECLQFVDQLQNFIFKLCKEAKYKNPKKLSQQILILLQGTMIYSQSKRDPKIALIAKEVLKLMLMNSVK
ncbi:MAG: TetR/AcrR family transcriptional regulator [Proteobacteria bacterium]|nr:TetR/AcrR family transcriptional regulator [Pseudomonadota bacterium]